MASRIKFDVLQALRDWKAGKPVKTVELGHVHRMKDVPGFSPTIDTAEHIHRDQDRAHAYCFHVIEYWISAPELTLPEHEEFLTVCDVVLEPRFRKENEGLTVEELEGAEGLAWKALRFGWARAIEGHKESFYIEVQNPTAVRAT
jgi:hypothetical protein